MVLFFFISFLCAKNKSATILPCNSTRSPGAGLSKYLHTVGPWIVGDFIWPNAQPDEFCKARESIVMLHTLFRFEINIQIS